MKARLTPELRRATLSGARWTASSRFVAELVALASSVLLARLISPAEFGHAAIALIVIALSAVLGTAGMSAPIVQKQELTDRLVGAVTLVSLVIGFALTVVTIAAAQVLVDPIFGARTANLVAIASVAWALVGIGAPSQALLQRNLRFAALAAIEITAVLSSAALAVSLAVAGVEGEALVAGGLAAVGVTSLLSLAVTRSRAIRTDLAAIRELLGFATPLALSSLVFVGFRNVDYAILGARGTAAQVGYYWRGYQLGVGYQSKISVIMLRVSFPVYSRAGSADELRAVRTRIVRTHATALVPLLAAFIVVAPIFIPWLYGPAWEPTVRPAQILAVAGMADAVMTGIGPLMAAIGQPGALLRWNVLVLSVYAAMVWVLAPHGVEAVAVGVAAFGVVIVPTSQGVLLRRYAGLGFDQLWRDIRAGMVVGAGILLAGTSLRLSLDSFDFPPIVALAILGSAISLVYAALLRVIFPREWTDILAIASRVRKRRPEPTGRSFAERGGDT